VEEPAGRACDADRDRAVSLLRAGLGDGRLSHDTFLVRLDAALRAKTKPVLAGLTADLRSPTTPLRRLRDLVSGSGASPDSRSSSRSSPPTADCRLSLPSLDASALVIGRRHQCDVVLLDDTVSRVHASLAWSDGQWVVTDRGSKNGTWVNGRRIWGNCTVEPGDSLRLGRVRVLLTQPGQQRFAV
jgi:Inner membrane component of T3SS, cytoplasmic domain/Domain of unknown function (DUF1707)